MSKSKYSPLFKESLAKEYISGNSSLTELSIKYSISKYTIRDWVYAYREQGIDAFINNGCNKKYSREFKKMCVEKVLSGEGSITEITFKNGITSTHVLRDWISRYNANIELKDYDPKREVYMAEARRKTTIEERKEIVEYCIKHNRDYKGTASIYDVSYSQVYSWVKKYDVNGEEGLTDKRGRHKTDDEVDELERLRRENLRLKRQLEEKDMAVELLKKVREFERM